MSGHPDDGSSLRRRPDPSPAGDQGLPLTGALLLRVPSVVPFVMIGALAAVTAVVLPLVLIIGPGSLEPIWRVARGRSAAWYVLSLAEFAGLELVPLAALRLSVLATTHGVKERPKPWLFPLVLAVALAGVVDAGRSQGRDAGSSLARAGLSVDRIGWCCCSAQAARRCSPPCACARLAGRESVPGSQP